MGDRKAVRGVLWKLVNKLEPGLFGVGSVGSSEKFGYLCGTPWRGSQQGIGQMARSAGTGISAEEATVPGGYPTLGCSLP